MNSLASFLLSALLLYKYWALFVVIFAAAIVLPLPTNELLMAVGASASQGYLNLYVSLAVAIGANVLGDSIGYFLARRYGRSALRMLHIRVPSYIERLEHYIGRHPGIAIFATRFFGAADPLTNVLSGFIGIPFTTFLFYDIVGNIVSIGGVVCAGYFLGAHWQDVTGLIGVAEWMVLGVVALVVLAWWYRRMKKKSADV